MNSFKNPAIASEQPNVGDLDTLEMEVTQNPVNELNQTDPSGQVRCHIDDPVNWTPEKAADHSTHGVL